MFKQIFVTTVVVASLALTGCAGKGKKNAPAPVASETPSGMSTSGAYDSSTAGTGLSGTSGIDLSKKVIYFEFDSADLSPEGQAVVANFAKYLVANPSSRLRLEGHADERGTREYNVGLGERRANAVQAALTAAGVSASQLSVVSYGEERPAASGSDESAWALNRRVELVQQ